MAGQVRVVAGPARSGKTAALVDRHLEALRRRTIGSALWLAPTGRAAEQVRGRLLSRGLDGCLSPGIYTFRQFADFILAEAEQPIRPIGRLLKRRLIERLVADALAAGQVEYFRAIADTAGLIDLLAALIGELKRQEISPNDFSRRVASLGPPAKHRELAALYAGYQRVLDERRLYDAEERFSLARELLQSGKWGPFAAAEHVVVDGFTDFTRTQQEILQLLASKVGQLTISLPLEVEPGREDLFAKPQQSLDEIRKSHPGVELKWAPRPEKTAWPAMTHLERYLFQNPLAVRPTHDTAGVEVVACAGQLAEMQAVARRIKELLVRGDHTADNRAVAPDEVVVVFRSTESTAGIVREVFDEFGIPTAIESRPPLSRSPALAALTALLKLQAEDWPFRGLVAVLANNYFRPNWSQWKQGRAGTAAEWAIRQLQIPRGREALLKSLEQRAKAPETDDLHQRPTRERYRAASVLLTRLSKLLAPLDRPRQITQWLAAVEELARETGLLAAAGASDAPGFSQFDRESWEHFKTALAAEEKLEQWLEAPRTISLAQFFTQVHDLLATEVMPVPSDEVGKVRVLSAQSCRAIAAPYLFVAGLSERSFPAATGDDRIYSDAEYRHLNEAGLHFADRRQRNCEEMLLFYEVVTRATRRLVLSYPALDSKAQPLLPSPYLIELERCFGEGNLKHTVDVSLSPVPLREQVYCPSEQRVKAVAELLGGQPERLSQLLHHNSASGIPMTAGLGAVAERANRSGFGEFEGILSSPAARQALSERYGPEHCWSVSRLETYATCPYRFFLSSVLRMKELPELALEVDYGRRGWLAHEALATLHRRLNDTGPCSPVAVGRNRLARFTDDTLAVLFEQLPAASPLQQALHKLDLRQVARWMQEYFDQHETYESLDAGAAGLRPAHFEVSFGLDPIAATSDPLSTECPYELQCGEEVVRLSGRIDRIDVGLVNGQVVFNVLDYKSGAAGRFTAEQIEAGQALQLPLYALAVQELLMVDRRAMPWRVGYWHLRGKGFQVDAFPACVQASDAGVEETDDWRSLRGTLLAQVMSLVRGIRGGAYPVFSRDDRCTSYCEFSTVCRIGQIRSLGKTWSSAATEAAP